MRGGGELGERHAAPRGSQATHDRARLGRRRDVRQRRHVGLWDKFCRLLELALDAPVFSRIPTRPPPTPKPAIAAGVPGRSHSDQSKPLFLCFPRSSETQNERSPPCAPSCFSIISYFLSLSSVIQHPLLRAPALGGPDFSRRFTGKTNGGTHCFFKMI